VKTGANEDSLWSRLYGGDGHSEFLCVQRTADEDFAVAGTSGLSTANSGDFWLMKIDQSGDSLWSRTYGGAAAERCECVRQTSDGGFVLAGRRAEENWDWDFWLVKTDADGDNLWSLRWGDANENRFTTGLLTADGGFVFGGWTMSDGNAEQGWLVKTGPELAAHDVPMSQSFCLLTNYPNPFNPTTTLNFSFPRTSRVTIRAYDLLGREVDLIADAMYCAGAHTIAWTPRDLASGTYWISMTGDGFQLVRKTILLR
jgi:hypothetical protein